MTAGGGRPASDGKRGPSRRRSRERELERARRVAVPASCDVCVVGGGASGLVAACVAAEAGARVVVLERDVACGRKILATGNGRCNFASRHLERGRYRNEGFVREVCGEAWLDDVLGFFEACGLSWVEEDGRLYPRSRQAASVRNVLMARCVRVGVTLAAAREVVDVRACNAAGFMVRYRGVGADDSVQATHELAAASVIVATGGVALTPDTSFGVRLSALGLAVTPVRPVLTPLACADMPMLALDGHRLVARVELERDGRRVWSEVGEVLVRAYGLSGIVIFNASRAARPGDVLHLDVAHDIDDERLASLCRAGTGDGGDGRDGGDMQDGCLDGVLDPQLGELLLRCAREGWWAPGQDAPVGETPRAALLRLAHDLPLEVTGLAQTEHAQAMRGGLAVDQMDPRTLEARGMPGLFACGEALDVDADCGGFNLAWAWKSGMVAGRAATAWASKGGGDADA